MSEKMILEVKERFSKLRAEYEAGKTEAEEFFLLLESNKMTIFELNNFLDKNDSDFDSKIFSKIQLAESTEYSFYCIKESMGDSERKTLWNYTKKKNAEWKDIYNSTVKGVIDSKKAMQTFCNDLNSLIDNLSWLKAEYELKIETEKDSLKELREKINNSWFMVQILNGIVNKVENLFHEKIQINKKENSLEVKTFSDLEANVSEEKKEIPFTPIECHLISKYPEYEHDRKLLLENGYMEVTENGKMRWLKNKNTLAQYFNSINKNPKNDWKIVETFFNVKDLKNSLSQNGNSYLKKPSEEFETLQKLKNTPLSN